MAATKSMSNLELCEYLAEIDGKTLEEWLAVTRNGLRGIDKLRIFYVAQYEAMQEVRNGRIQRQQVLQSSQSKASTTIIG